MYAPGSRGMSENAARGIGQLNQAAIHAAGSWTLKAPASWHRARSTRRAQRRWTTPPSWCEFRGSGAIFEYL